MGIGKIVLLPPSYQLFFLLGAKIFDAHITIHLRTCILHVLFMEAIFSSSPDSPSFSYSWDPLRKIPSLFIHQVLQGIWQSKHHCRAGS